MTNDVFISFFFAGLTENGGRGEEPSDECHIEGEQASLIRGVACGSSSVSRPGWHAGIQRVDDRVIHMGQASNAVFYSIFFTFFPFPFSLFFLLKYMNIFMRYLNTFFKISTFSFQK